MLDAPPLRFFLPRAGPNAIRAFVPRPHAHALDAFVLGARTGVEREWTVVMDEGGGLCAIAEEERAVLPAQVRTEISYHEISRGSAPRRIDAVEIYLFDLQLLEQPETLGPYDPVHLDGTLYGPYPGGPVAAVDGQLTITRADLLEGALLGAPHAFHYRVREGSGQITARAFHLVLGADRGEAIAQGRGVVLAYPLMARELAFTDASNEVLLSQILHDVLSALRQGTRDAGTEHPLRNLLLPVPNRALLEQKLESEGYVIHGDTATRRPGASARGFAGVLASVFGALVTEELTVPREGTLTEFLSLARTTVCALPDWPHARAIALRDRILQPGTEPTPPTLPVARTPVAGPPAPTPRAPVPRPLVRKGPPAWMKDFTDAPAPARPPAPSELSKPECDTAPDEPDWKKDFE